MAVNWKTGLSSPSHWLTVHCATIICVLLLLQCFSKTVCWLCVRSVLSCCHSTRPLQCVQSPPSPLVALLFFTVAALRPFQFYLSLVCFYLSISTHTHDPCTHSLLDNQPIWPVTSTININSNWTAIASSTSFIPLSLDRHLLLSSPIDISIHLNVHSVIPSCACAFLIHSAQQCCLPPICAAHQWYDATGEKNGVICISEHYHHHQLTQQQFIDQEGN